VGFCSLFIRAVVSTAPPQTDESSSWSAQIIQMKRVFLTRGPTSSHDVTEKLIQWGIVSGGHNNRVTIIRKELVFFFNLFRSADVLDLMSQS